MKRSSGIFLLGLSAFSAMTAFPGCAGKQVAFRAVPAGIAYRPPPVASGDLAVRTATPPWRSPVAPPFLPDEARGQWLTLFEVGVRTEGPVATGSLPGTSGRDDGDGK